MSEWCGIMKARTTSSNIFIEEMKPTKINAPTVCGNNPKWCESCISKGKCASTSPKGDLISREWLEDAFDNLCCHNCKICRNFRNEDSFYKCALLERAPTVDKGYDFGYADGHGEGYELGKNSRPQGECEKCDFRKFAETFVDAIVEVMNKHGITSVEQLSEMLKGGAE